MASSNYSYSKQFTVIRYQVCLSNINNFQTDLFDA